MGIVCRSVEAGQAYLAVSQECGLDILRQLQFCFGYHVRWKEQSLQSARFYFDRSGTVRFTDCR